ncbi:MAG: His-Xaa-Ser system radical SAM maturase HxsB [Deltaproteobacteria bacterium]|nr:His-Xaa-Ser system radical SAM maturase HxsB [Deltaproteobacteria bacterium]
MKLAPGFRSPAELAPSGAYRLLPFRFDRLDEHRYVVTNDVGEYVVLHREDLVALVRHELGFGHPSYRALQSRHFLFDDDSRVAVDLLALKYRTRADPVANFTGLHIFVVTLRCDHSCHYCQVSRQTEDRTQFDMQRGHAEKALELVFRSPSPSIKLEFQGGESLLNFELIRFIIERAEQLNRTHRRDLQFVIASNLSRLDGEMLEFCRRRPVFFSTSLDGPQDLHDAHRPLRGGSSYRAAVEGIARVQAELGPDRVAALMTTTPASLERVEEIIDEYVRRGFTSIFLRNMSPYGFAVRTRLVRRYDATSWIEFYKRGLAYILELNRRGHRMQEDFTAILLQKMFRPAGSAYVDLQSPAGIGIGAIVYNYDGAIYASDEGRMLAEMGDHSFRLGHLDDATFESVMTGSTLVDVLEDTLPESAPMCAECAFLPYCGADPVFHRATMGDPVGHKAFSAFCKKQMAVVRHVIGLLEDDEVAREIMLGWA